ncbi:MAG: tRNA (adenosine(37)-N6)-threonylcarbamoyltransferase complex ATPase subunit type 1 TsaE [Crocinitomicaceae bacterium]|nr:tRNA (adenosine(37)-N6)-threonylcarbamoyltransferase complex ATPase subunit type 1 TsaE [Crocinitomicaceae bacterium]
MQYIVSNIEELPKYASLFLEKFKNHKVFIFEAEMGTGKTTFIQEVLRQMGIEQPNGSPTYSLVNTYNSSVFGKIYHFDLYRIQDTEEIYDIGMEEMLSDGAYCFIEWPQVAESLLPENTIKIEIYLGEHNERIFKINLINTQKSLLCSPK